ISYLMLARMGVGARAGNYGPNHHTSQQPRLCRRSPLYVCWHPCVRKDERSVSTGHNREYISLCRTFAMREMLKVAIFAKIFTKLIRRGVFDCLITVLSPTKIVGSHVSSRRVFRLTSTDYEPFCNLSSQNGEKKSRVSARIIHEDRYVD